MIPAKVGHFVMAVFSAVSVSVLRARELVKEYPGCALALLILLALAVVLL